MTSQRSLSPDESIVDNVFVFGYWKNNISWVDRSVRCQLFSRNQPTKQLGSPITCLARNLTAVNGRSRRVARLFILVIQAGALSKRYVGKDFSNLSRDG